MASKIGKMRTLVTLTPYSGSFNAIGGYTATAGAGVDVWANVEPLNGSRGQQFEQLENSQAFRLTMYERSDFTTAYKVTIDSLSHDVHSIERTYKNDLYMSVLVYRKFDNG